MTVTHPYYTGRRQPDCELDRGEKAAKVKEDGKEYDAWRVILSSSAGATAKVEIYPVAK